MKNTLQYFSVSNRSLAAFFKQHHICTRNDDLKTTVTNTADSLYPHDVIINDRHVRTARSQLNATKQQQKGHS